MMNKKARRKKLLQEMLWGWVVTTAAATLLLYFNNFYQPGQPFNWPVLQHCATLMAPVMAAAIILFGIFTWQHMKKNDKH